MHGLKTTWRETTATNALMWSVAVQDDWNMEFCSDYRGDIPKAKDLVNYAMLGRW